MPYYNRNNLLFIVKYWQVTLGIFVVICYVKSLALTRSGFDVTENHKNTAGDAANISLSKINYSLIKNVEKIICRTHQN